MEDIGDSYGPPHMLRFVDSIGSYEAGPFVLNQRTQKWVHEQNRALCAEGKIVESTPITTPQPR